ncbi:MULTISPECIES: VENN motif pre-toxin domain-containing protein [Edwardsiella]|uniref:VENN motif pre-toxin domain-containing protein n=1 Tax=Edwardsiella TaxID=635 RepID=UPI00045CBF49|nr:VENN motif pre-toxin domain-containing protein [Edwardsiella anguillarum]RFT04287.1 hypothetical protein CGL57_06940 [Edwardsiella anguillarum]GAJ67360.1 tat pathway signal sequence [Edwardsiella piscicida]
MVPEASSGQRAARLLAGALGGNLKAGAAAGAAPLLASLVRDVQNDAARAALHGIVAAALTELGGGHGGDGLKAGAAGAVTASLAGPRLVRALYGKEDMDGLSPDEKRLVSNLVSVIGGIAGYTAGDTDIAMAVIGANAARVEVENNLLGGSEWLQTDKAREHAADVLSCRDNPSGEACRRGLAENKAYAAALATGSVALLPGGAQAMWGLGAGANAGIGYLADGSIDPANVAIAGWVNVISMGNGLAGTVGWNAAGGALGSWIDDKDPLSGALINGAGSGIGYGIGKGLSWGVNAGANWWKGGWDPKFNAELRSVTEVKGELGLSKEMKPSNLPRSFGDISSSFSSEYGGKKLEPIIEDKLK